MARPLWEGLLISRRLALFIEPGAEALEAGHQSVECSSPQLTLQSSDEGSDSDDCVVARAAAGVGQIDSPDPAVLRVRLDAEIAPCLQASPSEHLVMSVISESASGKALTPLRVIVFGGSGFIGSHVADALSDAGHAVAIFDREPSPYLRASQRLITGDIIGADKVAKSIEGHNLVNNFADELSIERSIDHSVAALLHYSAGHTRSYRSEAFEQWRRPATSV